MEPAEKRYLVLSDMHFGTLESSINRAEYRRALVEYVVSRAPWEEIIFTGDLLDVNLSTLTSAIEGHESKAGTSCGFRNFLEELDRSCHQLPSPLTLNELATRWIYVPGNHDYKIWDLLATRANCEDVLSSGARLDPGKMPLARGAWPNGASFFAGIFKPFGTQARVAVEYPDHEVAFGGDTMVFTHGHYLDVSQTRGHDLTDNLRDTPPNVARNTIHNIIVDTAQYQAVANAVSFKPETRSFVSALVGPRGLWNRLHQYGIRIVAWLARLLFVRRGALRGESLSEHQLENIETYLGAFREGTPTPRWFVFGHTHRQGYARSPRRNIEVYNAGSCYPDHDLPITFLEVDVNGAAPVPRLMCVDAAARVHASADART